MSMHKDKGYSMNRLSKESIEQVNLAEMLDARERRLFRQQKLLKTYEKPLVSFSLNIVGPVKVFFLAREAFKEGIRLIEEQCHAWGFPVIAAHITDEKTGQEKIWVIDSDAVILKRTLCCLEESVSMGRLFDIDVIDVDGSKISRSDLDLPKRNCLLCNQEAFVCSRSRTHSVEDLLSKELDMMQMYFASHYARKISSIAMQALLYEVSATPKPGLVDRDNNGSHSDMDIFTFERSAVSLHHYFEEFVLCGFENCEKNLPRIFRRIRPLGIQAESSMMEATGNVNTHKGLIFSLGIICCALGYLYGNQIPYTPDTLSKTCQDMVAEVLDDFTGITAENARTHGEKLYARYGIRGARGEAIDGFPTAIRLALPKLKEFLLQNFSMNDAGILTLLFIIAHTEDTNIVARSSYETMKTLQQDMKTWLNQTDFAGTDYISYIRKLDEQFISLHVSPGGSADILAITYFLYFIEHMNKEY